MPLMRGECLTRVHLATNGENSSVQAVYLPCQWSERHPRCQGTVPQLPLTLESGCLLVVQLTHFRFPAHKSSRAETYKYSSLLNCRKLHLFQLSCQILCIFCVCLCVREIVVICFSFWPVKIWQIAEFCPSWQMIFFLLKKGMCEWMHVCKWKETSVLLQGVPSVPSQPWGAQSNIKHECLWHVFRSGSQTPAVSDCPFCMSLLFLTWQEDWQVLCPVPLCLLDCCCDLLLCTFFLSAGTFTSTSPLSSLVLSGHYCWGEQEWAAPEWRGSR